MNLSKALSAIALTAVILVLTGCGIGNSAPVSVAGAHFSGSIHGGQQPVSDVTMQLYAAGSTGYGSAYTYNTGSSLLGNNVVTSDVNGNFSITDDYTCPSSSTLVYLVGTGGHPIVGQAANNNLAMMAALGPCGALSPSTFISMNELTTVASVWALSPFMSGIANIGTSSTNSVGLINAFAAVNKLVDTRTGTVIGPTLPSDAILPINEINTLADILAACINTTGGNAGDSNPCGTLFTLAHAAGGAQPADTINAAMNIAKNPSQNVAALNELPTPSAPFQPTLGNTPPAAWTIAIRYKANDGFASPSGLAADQAGNIWVANKGTGNVIKVDTNGAVLSGVSGFAVGQAALGAVAIDQIGNAWTPGSDTGSILKITPSGVATSYTGGGIGTTTSIAIDGLGQVWVSGNLGVSAFASDGTAISPSGAFTGGGVTNGQTIAIR